MLHNNLFHEIYLGINNIQPKKKKKLNRPPEQCKEIENNIINFVAYSILLCNRVKKLK